MFKACFRNFIRNLKYVFVEVGFMYLGLLFGFDVFFRQLGIGFEQFKAAFSQLWESGDTDLFMTGIQEVLSSFAMGAVGFLAIQILQLILGYILIMLMIRTDIEKRNIFKVLLSALVDAALLVIYIVVVVALLNVAPWADILVLLLFLPLYSVVTLLGSYINHGLKLVGIKRIITLKNVLKLATGNFLVILATIGLAALCAWVFNIIIGFTLMVALFMIGICTISLNADTYMNSVIEAAKTNKQLEEAIEAAKSEKYATLLEIKGKTEEKEIEAVNFDEKVEDKKVEEQPKVEEKKEEKAPKTTKKSPAKTK